MMNQSHFTFIHENADDILDLLSRLDLSDSLTLTHSQHRTRYTHYRALHKHFLKVHLLRSIADRCKPSPLTHQSPSPS
jgi:hypothetical protein